MLTVDGKTVEELGGHYCEDVCTFQVTFAPHNNKILHLYIYSIKKIAHLELLELVQELLSQVSGISNTIMMCIA